MPFINVTTDTGELVERINVDDYNLGVATARSALLAEVFDEVERAYDIEVRRTAEAIAKNRRSAEERGLST